MSVQPFGSPGHTEQRGIVTGHVQIYNTVNVFKQQNPVLFLIQTKKRGQQKHETTRLGTNESNDCILSTALPAVFCPTLGQPYLCLLGICKKNREVGLPRIS